MSDCKCPVCSYEYKCEKDARIKELEGELKFYQGFPERNLGLRWVLLEASALIDKALNKSVDDECWRRSYMEGRESSSPNTRSNGGRISASDFNNKSGE